jgi:hypothetical protein
MAEAATWDFAGDRYNFDCVIGYPLCTGEDAAINAAAFLKVSP